MKAEKRNISVLLTVQQHEAIKVIAKTKGLAVNQLIIKSILNNPKN